MSWQTYRRLLPRGELYVPSGKFLVFLYPLPWQYPSLLFVFAHSVCWVKMEIYGVLQPSILSIRRWCRPPSKSSSSHAFTISRAFSLDTARAPMAIQFALLWAGHLRRPGDPSRDRNAHRVLCWLRWLRRCHCPLDNSVASLSVPLRPQSGRANEIGVIAGFFTVAAKVQHFMAALLKQCDNGLF